MVEPFISYRPAHNKMPSWPDWMAWMDQCFPVVGWNLPLWRVAGVRRRGLKS